MRIPRVHVPFELAEHARFALPPEAARHLRQSLRARPGQPLVVFDGRGGEYEAKVEALDARAVRVATGAFRPVDREPPVRVRLAQGIARGERMDFAVQKAVELGVAELTPLFTERTVVRLAGARAERRREHWQAVAVQACQQCGRNRIPEVRAPLALERWLERVSENGHVRGALGLALDPGAGRGLAELGEGVREVALLIGPEGGLSDAELARTRGAGFVPLRLGPRTLRTETAAIAALAAIQTRWGDLGAPTAGR